MAIAMPRPSAGRNADFKTALFRMKLLPLGDGTEENFPATLADRRPPGLSKVVASVRAAGLP
jgi:hypothetical protein